MNDHVLSRPENEIPDYLRKMLESEDAISEFEDCCETLMMVVREQPDEVNQICTLADSIINAMPENETKNACKASNFSATMAAAFFQEDYARVESIFAEGLDFCKRHSLYDGGRVLIEYMINMRDSASCAADELFSLLRIATEFYISLGCNKDAVETLCCVALKFADVQAFSSAYRAISDAQEIAMQDSDPLDQVRVLETNAMVGLMENDLDFAASEFEKCLELLTTIGDPASISLRANAALVELRSNRFESAAAMFESLIDDYPDEQHRDSRLQFLVNLLICKRECGENSLSMDLIKQLDEMLDDAGTEERIETQLVIAKSLMRFDQVSLALHRIRDASLHIQREVDPIQRLHYRRGVREKYTGRLRGLITGVPRSGVADDLLPILILCSSNGILDWCSVLKWCDEVDRSDSIPDHLKAELHSSLNELANFGTPFLYGFYEKYDDPFEMPEQVMNGKVGEEVAQWLDRSRPWRRFNIITSKIQQHTKIASPYHEAKLELQQERLTRRLEQGAALMFTFMSTSSCELILVSDSKYHRFEVPLVYLKEYVDCLRKYQGQTLTRPEFIRSLNEFENRCSSTFSEVAALIELNQTSELIVVSDFFTEAISFLPAILAREQLRSRIRDGKFVYRMCPALWEEPYLPMETGSIVFVHNSQEQLELALSESVLVQQANSGREFATLDLAAKAIDLTKGPLSEASILHLSTHSIPAAAFTDPAFVSTVRQGDQHSISLESVQREARNSKVCVVFLNGCNTGLTMNWNYFKTFATNEKAGIATAFLLNRRSSVVASSWNVVEVAAFVFSYLFYERLTEKSDPALAFITAMADLFDLTKENALKIYGTIADDDQRDRRIEALERSKDEYPYRNAYVLGMFQFHGLLVK